MNAVVGDVGVLQRLPISRCGFCADGGPGGPVWCANYGHGSSTNHYHQWPILREFQVDQAGFFRRNAQGPFQALELRDFRVSQWVYSHWPESLRLISRRYNQDFIWYELDIIDREMTILMNVKQRESCTDIHGYHEPTLSWQVCKVLSRRLP